MKLPPCMYTGTPLNPVWLNYRFVQRTSTSQHPKITEKMSSSHPKKWKTRYNSPPKSSCWITRENECLELRAINFPHLLPQAAASRSKCFFFLSLRAFLNTWLILTSGGWSGWTRTQAVKRHRKLSTRIQRIRHLPRRIFSCHRESIRLRLRKVKRTVRSTKKISLRVSLSFSSFDNAKV